MNKRRGRKRRNYRRRKSYNKKNSIIINPRSKVIVPMRKVENLMTTTTFQKNLLEFTADGFPAGFTGWAGVFDMYRLVGVKQVYYPNVTSYVAPQTITSEDSTISADATSKGNLNSPLMLIRTMRDTQNSIPVDVDEALEQPSYKIYDLKRKSITIKWKPNILSEVIDDSALTSSQTPVFGKWLSVAEGNVPYYGVHRCISTPGANISGYLQIRIITTFYVEFKQSV